MRRLALVAASLVLAACMKQLPAPPAPRTGTDVTAPLAKVWDAVIDDFAERNIPVRTMDRASGFISAEPLRTGTRATFGTSPSKLADCGRTPVGTYLQPTMATYNVLVRGDSMRALVTATVRWTTPTPGQVGSVTECSTTGSWEAAFEDAVKARAEGAVTAAAPRQP